MEENFREIPGYYYDKEKKKYFKIQENSPASSAYSSQDVKRRKARDEKNEEKAEADARQKGRVRRADIVKTSLSGHIFRREIGRDRRCRLDGPRIYARGLLPRGRVSPAVNGNFLFALNHRPDLGQSMIDIRSASHSQLLTARFNTDKCVRSGRAGSLENCNESQSLRSSEELSWLVELFGDPGPTTSLSVHTCGAVAMTWLSGSSNSGVGIAPPAGSQSDAPEIPERHDEASAVVLGPGVNRGSEANVFSSTAAPPESPYAFAFGSSYGLLMADVVNVRLNWLPLDRYPRHESPKDVFALEFSADNHNVLFSGCRKGIINIIDLRVPNHERDIINHPSTITHVRQLDRNRIIVAGLNSSLCQYDLRFRRQIVTMASTARRPNKSFRNESITNPVLQYPGFHNDSSIHLGFDVDLETGTVAAGQEMDEFNPHLRLFSLYGGHEVPPPKMPLDFKTGDNVGCVKFFDDIQGRAKSLYVGCGFVQRFAWTDSGDDDP